MVLECKYQQAVLMIDEGKIVNAYEALTALGDYSDSADLLRTIKPIYRRILAKPNLFVNNLWDEENQTRIWVETTVLDSNTMYINITGSNGADDHSSEDLNGIWDESIGMVKFSGIAYRTTAGYTYCTNDNVVGYLYYKNGYLCLVYGENPDASPMRFQ